MIRTEVLHVPAARGDQPTLRNVYGFAWNANAPENQVSPTAVVRAEIEYVDTGATRVTLRPGVWYGGDKLMTRVWLTSSGPGKVALDAGLEKGDVALASDAPAVTPWIEVHLGPVSTADALNNPINFDLRKPAGARTLVAFYRIGAIVDPGAAKRAAVDLFDELDAAIPLNGIGSRWSVATHAVQAYWQPFLMVEPGIIPAGAIWQPDIGLPLFGARFPLPAHLRVAMYGAANTQYTNAEVLAWWGS